jgi:hypothetical protein
MTINEKIEMYKNKKAFIDDISKAFEVRSEKTGIVSIEYEVYSKEDYVTEYLVVNFVGGAKSVRCANGNSHSANYQEIGKLIDGGYYTELRTYNSLVERGFKKVEV